MSEEQAERWRCEGYQERALIKAVEEVRIEEGRVKGGNFPTKKK
jgi:hypothetical protein